MKYSTKEIREAFEELRQQTPFSESEATRRFIRSLLGNTEYSLFEVLKKQKKAKTNLLNKQNENNNTR